MDPKILEQLGLTRNESLVYLTLLQIGTAKTGEILTKSRLNSGKIYEILEALKAKGLASESLINNTRQFAAAPPAQLRWYVQRKKEGIAEEERIAETLIGRLEKTRADNPSGTKAVTYVGPRAIQTAADEALAAMKPGEEILAMGVTQHKGKQYNDFWKRWSAKRIAKKVVAKHLFSEQSKYSAAFKRMPYTEVKVLSGLTPVTVDIFGNDKVLILNYAEPASCILIFDKHTAASFRQFFAQLWKSARNRPR